MSFVQRTLVLALLTAFAGSGFAATATKTVAPAKAAPSKAAPAKLAPKAPAPKGATTKTTRATPVKATAVNQPPVFSSLTAKTVAEASALSFLVSATDPEGSAVTITAAGLMPWMTFSANKLTATPGYSDAGAYTVNFTAKDSAGGRAVLPVTITVLDTNRAPSLSITAPLVVGEGFALSVPITANDLDGDALTVTAVNLPTWASFDGRTLRATPPAGAHGSYNFSLTVSDGKTPMSALAPVTVTQDDSAFPQPWTRYFGSQWTGAAWAGTERAWLGYLTGLNLMDYPNKINDLVAEVSARIQSRDVIVSITGFGGDADTGTSLMGRLFDMHREGNGGSWQAAVEAQVQALSPLDPDAKHLTYQLGNEIGKQTFSEALRAWATSKGLTLPGTAQEHDLELIPYYVEYYLAPTVEAAQRASLAYYGDAEAVNLALGSIPNGGTPGARAFLDALLAYEVQGDYAPTLTGKKVNELVDLITAHYVGASDNLGLIWDKWAGVGSLHGLWTTEVVGIRSATDGAGAASVLFELGNHLGWHYAKGFLPEQARVSVYGWSDNNGIAAADADEALSTFYAFMGDAPLEVEKNYATVASTGSPLKTVQFNSVTDNDKRAVAVTAEQQSATGTLQAVTVAKAGWAGAVTAQVHLFTAAGHQVLPASVVDTGSAYQVTLTRGAQVSGGSAVLVTLLRN